MKGQNRLMDSRDQVEAKGLNIRGYDPEVSIGENPAKVLRGKSSGTISSFSREAASRFSEKTCFAGSNWSGNIMWTFAFGEKETSEMAGSVFSSGRQAWHLLNHMNDLCKTRHTPMPRSSVLVIQLASELRAIAIECLEARFALELRVIKGADGLLDLELMDNGMWRKPSLRVSMKSQPGTIMVGMGD
jgi:hypothetical protein